MLANERRIYNTIKKGSGFSFTAKELSDETEISIGNIYRYLNIMVRKGVIKRELTIENVYVYFIQEMER